MTLRASFFPHSPNENKKEEKSACVLASVTCRGTSSNSHLSTPASVFVRETFPYIHCFTTITVTVSKTSPECYYNLSTLAT